MLEEYYIEDILIDEDDVNSTIVNGQDDKFLSFYLPGLFDLSIEKDKILDKIYRFYYKKLN